MATDNMRLAIRPYIPSVPLSTLVTHVSFDSVNTHCLVDNADGFTINDLVLKPIALEFQGRYIVIVQIV
jgi:hypothetical protein